MLRSDVCLFKYPVCFARWQHVAVMTTVQHICRQANANLFSLRAARLQLELQVSCSCERRAAPVLCTPAAQPQPRCVCRGPCPSRRHCCCAVRTTRRCLSRPSSLWVGHFFFRCRFASVLSAGRAPAERARAANAGEALAKAATCLRASSSFRARAAAARSSAVFRRASISSVPKWCFTSSGTRSKALAATSGVKLQNN